MYFNAIKKHDDMISLPYIRVSYAGGSTHPSQAGQIPSLTLQARI